MTGTILKYHDVKERKEKNATICQWNKVGDKMAGIGDWNVASFFPEQLEQSPTVTMYCDAKRQ